MKFCQIFVIVKIWPWIMIIILRSVTKSWAVDLNWSHQHSVKGSQIVRITIRTLITQKFRIVVQNHRVMKLQHFHEIHIQTPSSEMFYTKSKQVIPIYGIICTRYDDDMTWKRFPHYWPFVRGIHWSQWFPSQKASNGDFWWFLCC